MATYNSPLAVQRADPYIYKHTDGKYYFTATFPNYDRLAIRCADSINGLTDAYERVVWVKHNFGPLSSHIWAPEIHYIMGKWVIYFAAGSLPDIWEIRPYALVCDSDDPMTGNWSEAGRILPAKNDPYSFTDFSLDMTVFENKGRWYAIWAEKVGRQHGISNLYIAELATPTRLKTVQVLLTTPDYDWERIDFWVNEGPTVMHHNGKIFCAFSASATGAMYCMGLLSASEDADLLDPTSWKKRNKPVCTTDESIGVYGPGHNSFTVGDEGETLCVLHFRSYEKIIGDPLLDHNRHAHVMRVTFDENDEPVFD
ncbi:MAG: family 43 glycosylhydrolase, partial [Christensenellaceae bacterium]